MRKYRQIIVILLAVLMGLFSLSGCNLMRLINPEPTAIPVTPTPIPVTELTICLGYEPRSLYPYQASSQAAQEVLQAIYDGPIDILNGGQIEPVILEKMPEFSDKSAFFTPVSVSEGDVVINTYGDLVTLKIGTRVFPDGCTSPTCAVVWDGTSELLVNQLTATFELLGGLKWSDGQPLSASDSLYAFMVASDPATPANKQSIDQTDSYTVVNDTTVKWVGKPGLVTDTFEQYFWAPMPEHAWGEYSADELLDAEKVNRSPLGWGAYVVDEWQPGVFIRLRKNPNYFRAAEGLPLMDIITFKFLVNAEPDTILQVAEAECDIVSSTALDLQDIIYLSEHVQSSGFSLEMVQPTEIEMLAIGITPYAYDDNYYPYGGDRPDIFGDTRTRQAIAYCMDRDTINNKLLGGVAEITNSLLAVEHPLLEGVTLMPYSYDPTLGISLLEQVGWRDLDLNPDTPLIAEGVNNVPQGTVFEIELLISESPLRGEIASEIAAGLANCGIRANISQVPASELYQPGPDGPIFGRQFDLALLSWQTGGRFDCRLFTTSEIPTDANFWVGEKTGGANYYGFSNLSYDENCALSAQGGLDTAASIQAERSALQILNNELPFMPVYHHPVSFLKSKDVCGFIRNIDQKNRFLMDIENLYIDVTCVDTELKTPE
ncbi:hypothetical protein DRH14_04060 [Candidatus Shapirobacteria bacterium]|nr:MAG: hypothetical protein DRH14_04060 [Candidatus Shapirobacteria bacterium]